MNRDEFWNVIESCRDSSTDMVAFNQVLEGELRTWDLERLWSFHSRMWITVNEINEPGSELGEWIYKSLNWDMGGDSGECLAGWVIAQGEAFVRRLLQQPRVLTALPQDDEILQGESVIFAAQRVCLEWTGGSSLEDLFWTPSNSGLKDK
jgi:hypothetical protein